jgi:hypothetical protein
MMCSIVTILEIWSLLSSIYCVFVLSFLPTNRKTCYIFAYILCICVVIVVGPVSSVMTETEPN